MIKDQQYVRAAKYIDAFGMNNDFDSRKLASQLINRDQAELSIRLVSKLENKDALKQIINKLDLFKYNALASTAIKSNGLDHREFPKILSH